MVCLLKTTLAVLATATLILAAPLDVYGDENTTPGTTITPRGWFSSAEGTVNFYARTDCHNKCVDTMYCDDELEGDLNQYKWSEMSGETCWDLPAGTKSIGLVFSEGTRYVGITADCKAFDDQLKKTQKTYDYRALVWGKGKSDSHQKCNGNGALADDVRAVVYEK